MHYYKRNLGDYAKKAGRLSMLQHGSYTLLIDACYDREQFPTRDEAIDWTWASSSAEIEAVDFVLSKFFTLEDGRYVQTRIREELSEYKEKAETNKRIANEREKKRKENATKRAQSVNEPPPNHKPITNNQEPIKEKQERAPRFDAQAHLVSIGVDASIASDWITSRKSLKAPPTQTAIDGIARESARAGISLADALSMCCQRGWRGFKAEWVKEQPSVGYQDKRQERDSAYLAAIGMSNSPRPERLISGEVLS